MAPIAKSVLIHCINIAARAYFRLLIAIIAQSILIARCKDRAAFTAFTERADSVIRPMIWHVLSAVAATMAKAGVAVIAVAVIILVSKICATLFTRIGGIIASVTQTVYATLIGQVVTTHAAFGTIFVLTAVAEGLKAFPIPVGSAAGLAQARKAIPAALARSSDQRIRISVGNTTIIAGGKIALIFMVIRLNVAAGAVTSLGFTTGNRSAA